MRQDLLYALRHLRKNPGYALVTVLTLALGIGANTAIFSVVNGVILKPLPYPDASRLVFITSQFPGLGFDQFWVSAPEFLEFRERNQSFQDVGGYRAGAVNLGTADQPRRVNSALITSELMPVLGVAPIRGRQFTRADTLPGAEDVAVLSSEVWRAAFGGDESVIGRVIPIDGTPTRIVGIMPPGYDIHDVKAQVWLPLTLDPANPGNRGGHFLYLVGRLKDGVGMAQANADVERMLQQWSQLNRDTHVPSQTGHRLRLDGLQDDLVGGIRTALFVLQGAVAFVLLIACANLANLLLARAESRQKEFAIRSALGAGRWRLLRQFLTEGVVLALIGGVVGAAIGFAGLRALVASSPDSIPRSTEIALDPVVLLFTVVVSVLTGLLFGMAPLLQLREQAVTVSLKESGQRTTAGSARARVRGGLVMAEVALAVVLVIGAGLLLRSFWNLMTFDAGFNRSRLVTFGIVLTGHDLSHAGERRGLLQPADRPAVGATRRAGRRGDDRAPAGAPGERERHGLRRLHRAARRAGREHRLLPDRDPRLPEDDGHRARRRAGFRAVGRRGRPGRPRQRDAREDVLQEGEPDWEAPEARVRPEGAVVHDRRRRRRREAGRRQREDGDRAVFLQRAGPVGRAVRAAQHEHRAADGAAARVGRAADSADRAVHGSHTARRQAAHDGGGVCGVGLEAALPRATARRVCRARLDAGGGRDLWDPSYSVSERRREIGIHMALGATRANVLGMVLGQGLRLTAVGLVIGLAASFGLTRVLQAQLFNVRPSDPATIASVAAFIALVAFAACYIPASRATRVDPMVVLRDE